MEKGEGAVRGKRLELVACGAKGQAGRFGYAFGKCPVKTFRCVQAGTDRRSSLRQRKDAVKALLEALAAMFQRRGIA